MVEQIKVLVDEERLNRLEEKIDRLLSDKGKGEDEVLNAQEIADMLKLNTQTVYRLARDGEIPSMQCGRARLFSKRAVLQKLEEK